MEGLDEAAWERWKEYRTAIRKPIKSVSEHAMKVKLARYGSQQDAVVSQSIENQYQGLFDLKVSKPQPGEKPVKSDKQVAAENARFDSDNSRSQAYWDKHGLSDDLGRLKLCEALLARYTLRSDEIGHGDRMEQLRNVVADCMQSVSSIKVLDNPSLLSMIRHLWGEKGVNRLKARAKTERGQGTERSQDVVADMVGAVHQ